MIDTHCHVFNDDNYTVDEIVSNMGDNLIIFSGASKVDIENTIDAVSKYENCYGTIGFHPDEASIVTDKDIVYLENNLSNPKIVGIGEIGLDYYHDTDKNKQKDLFIKQLDLARKYKLPVVIHSRDAASDTYEILKNYKDLKKVLHCYSYSVEMAYKFLDIGCSFGVGGVVTFKNAKTLVDVVSKIDIENLLLETDSPYLSPEPFRGFTNQPCNITYVANKISEIKEIAIEDVYKITLKNACEIYNIKI